MDYDDIIYASINQKVSKKFDELIIPETWITVLNLIRTKAPKATIAGGALRDLDNGRPIKDVDIFIPYGDITYVAFSILFFECPYVIDMEEVSHDAATGCSRLQVGSNIPSHYRFIVNGWQFDITQKVEDFTHTSIVESFDLGICMISLDGLKVYRAPQYVTDATNKTITILREKDEPTMLHLERIREKYLTWEVMNGNEDVFSFSIP